MRLIAYILNYNKDDNARRIHSSLPCENYVIDSSGINKPGFIQTDHKFVSGSMNKAISMFLGTDATHALFICSDVIGDWSSVVKRILSLKNDVGIYSPSVDGKGWKHEKPQGLDLRDVPFVEGIIICYQRKIVEAIYPQDIVNNKHGYGVDIYASYFCKKKKLRCIIDDSIMMYHPHSPSDYLQVEGERQMEWYVNQKGEDFKKYCQSLGLLLPFYKRVIKFLKK
jgi:hypothetical protein